jgi:hypothetical protein
LPTDPYDLPYSSFLFQPINLNPVGRQNYAISAVICALASLNENGPALGAQAGEKGKEK